MIMAAVLSARANTTLQAHCLYDGRPNDLTSWLSDNGVTVHFHQVPFRDELFSKSVVERNRGSLYVPEHAAGTFLRTQAAAFATGSQFLYTDCDVMFLRDIEPLSCNFGAVSEGGNVFNCGVLLIDRAYYLSIYDALIAYFREHAFYEPTASSYDQAIAGKFFRDAWTSIDAGYNWRPWMGINPEAKIVHFHGPKPTRVRAILDGEHLPEEAGLLPFVEKNPAAYKHYIDLYQSYLNMAETAQASPQRAAP